MYSVIVSQQSKHIRFFLVYTRGFDNEPDVVLAAVVALIARAYDSENCFKFYHEEITDGEFADSLFKKIGLKRLSRDPEGAYIAVVLISVQLALKNATLADKMQQKKSALLSDYRHLSVNHVPLEQDKRNYAINVIQIIDNYPEGQNWIFERFGRDYLDVMKHIELLLPKDNDSE